MEVAAVAASLTVHVPITSVARAATLFRRPTSHSVSVACRRPLSVVVRAQQSEAEPSYAGEGASTTVFPAEALEELGPDVVGDVKGIGKEVKLPPKPESSDSAPLKGLLDAFKPDVQTISYDGPKTVFPGEACDELGGEFCEPDYQEGVGEEKRL